LVHNNKILLTAPVWGGGSKFAGTLLGPEATPVLFPAVGLGQVVSLHLGGGVWCLFNWIVVASIFKQNCCFL
jgi:hypothetical protein